MSSEPNRKAPYAADLRWKVVYQKLSRDSTLSKIACNFTISVHNVLKCFTLTGEVAAKAQGTRLGSRKLSVREDLFVISLVLERPSIYLQEVCEEVSVQIGVMVSVPTVC